MDEAKTNGKYRKRNRNNELKMQFNSDSFCFSIHSFHFELAFCGHVSSSSSSTYAT